MKSLMPHLIIITISIVGIPLIAFAQDASFFISAKITGIMDGTSIYLENLSTGQIMDSVQVNNQLFEFSGSLPQVPEELRIHSGLAGIQNGTLFYMDLLIGNEKVRLWGDVSDMPLNINSSGSETQRKAEKYSKQLHSVSARRDSLISVLHALPDSIQDHGTPGLKTLIENETKVIENFRTEFVKENFDSYIGMLTYLYYRYDFKADTIKTLYDGLPEKLKQSKYGKAIAIHIKYPPPNAGQLCYDFIAMDPQGGTHAFFEMNDAYTLLQFAGAGCYYSNRSMEELKEIHDEFADSLKIVSFYIDAQKDAWLKNIEEHSIPWLCLSDGAGKYSEIYHKYGVTGTPAFYLIDSAGIVMSKWYGYEKGMIKRMIELGMSGRCRQ